MEFGLQQHYVCHPLILYGTYSCATESRCGSAFDAGCSILAINYMHMGLWFFNISATWTKISASSGPVRHEHIQVPVELIRNGHAALMGTFKGYAIIVETKNGAVVQVLEHGSKCLSSLNDLILTLK